MDNVFRNYQQDCPNCTVERQQENIRIIGYGNAVIDGGKPNGLEEFTSLKEIEFNGKYFLGFSNPEQYLENRYGDFMQLPKEEDRVSHHGFIAYKKNV